MRQKMINQIWKSIEELELSVRDVERHRRDGMESLMKEGGKQMKVFNSTDTPLGGAEKGSFTCRGCNNELPSEYNVRTDGFCFLCDPKITLEECLSDEPLTRIPKNKEENK